MAGSQDPSHLRQMEDLEKRYKYLAAEVEEVAELIFCHLEWIQNCSKRWQTVRIGIWLQKMNNLRLTKLRLWCCIRDVLRSPPCRVCAAVEIQREHLCWIFKNHKDSLCYYVGSRWIIVFSQLVCFQSRFSAAYCILLSLHVPCIYMKFVLDLGAMASEIQMSTESAWHPSHPMWISAASATPRRIWWKEGHCLDVSLLLGAEDTV